MPADIIDEEYLNTISPSEKNGYIGGLLASSITRTNSIGFIGGMESKKSQSECAAFQDAVHSVNADTAIELAYAGSFSDSLKGAELARSMIGAESVDVIFSDASYVDIGVLKEIGQTASPCALVRVLCAAQESGPQDAAYALMDQILSQIKREVDLFQGKTFHLSVGDAFVGWVFRNSGAGQSSQ